MKSKNISGYTDNEEIANYLTHILGIFLSVYVLLTLILQGIQSNNKTVLISYIVYGLSLIALYTSSSIYHIVKNNKLKKFFKKLDHICIYYLIAGSYTPLMLNKVEGETGTHVTILVWSIALIGTIYKLTAKKSNKILSTSTYLLMGWLVVFFWPEVKSSLSTESIKWLAIGGGFYSVGVIFYSLKKIPYTHAIWHLFVLAGSFSHYMSIKVA